MATYHTDKGGCEKLGYDGGIYQTGGERAGLYLCVCNSMSTKKELDESLRKDVKRGPVLTSMTAAGRHVVVKKWK